MNSTDDKNVTISTSKRYLNSVELAEYLGKSKWWVYDRVKNREIPFIPIGREPRFDLRLIDEWMRKKVVRAV